MTVRLSGRRGLPLVDRPLLRRHARLLLRSLDRRGDELSVTLVDDETMAALNERYRGIAAPTDVLSFSLAEGSHVDRRGALLGDVVISLETAVCQARRGRRSLEDEVLRLLIHGALHLVGHDHVRADEAREMRAEERRIRRAISA